MLAAPQNDSRSQSAPFCVCGPLPHPVSRCSTRLGPEGQLDGDLGAVGAVLEKLQVFTMAESLGGVESLVGHPATMSHSNIPAEQRRELGIDDNLIRLSVGIENVDDLIADLDQALAR